MEKNSIKVLLVSLANMYSGNWDYMYKHIALNKKYNYEEALKSFSNIKSNVITIMDSDLYPKEFNQILHPPFVLFYYGNISLLKNKNKLAVIGSRQNTSYGKKVTEDMEAVHNVWMESYRGAIFEANYIAGSKNSAGKSKSGRLLQNGCEYMIRTGKCATCYECLHYYYDNSTASNGGPVRFFDSNKNELSY